MPPVSIALTTLPSSESAISAPAVEGQGGLTGLVLTVVGHLGEIGIGALTFIETVFPPIPSEIVLPLGGYLAQRGTLDVWWLLLAATVGSIIGSWVLYVAGARMGMERSARVLARLPLVDRGDVDRAVNWFERRGEWAVFLGRLMPGVRSLVSLPAGAAGMSPIRFTILTAAGSLLWNALLIGGGYALGSQYQLVEEYTEVLDKVLIGGLALVLVVFVVRRMRRNSAVPGV